jgi:hypothetical protein
MRVVFGIFATLAIFAQAPSHDHSAVGNGKVILLPRDLEMRLAVNALPKVLRDGAAVLVLESGAYVKAKPGTNPFTCMVSRRGGNFYPVCFDEEGTRTILPSYADDALMRLKGLSPDEVEKQLAKGFADGKYQPPARSGIAYMLSPLNYMVGADGKLARNAPPHTMFYAPFVTDAAVGGMPGRTAFIDRPGPHGMFIVLAGKSERESYAAESKELMDEVWKATGLEE